MAFPKINPTTTAAWKKLQARFEAEQHTTIAQHFDNEPERLQRFAHQWEDFYVDFSKNNVSQKALNDLLVFAEQCGLQDAISAYFGGDSINTTENRAVLHTALRSATPTAVRVKGAAIAPGIAEVKAKMKDFSTSVIEGQWKGHTGKAITTIVNIGIGGSDLGPAMVCEALEHYRNHLKVYFVSNVEGDHVQETIAQLDPETTLFVVVSKTFTTQETMTNANTLREWLVAQLGEEAVAKHFVAVSTNIEQIKAFGIAAENIFPMNDWVGGRFSLWSAVGLSICLTVGPKHFDALLSGAGALDTHFKTAPWENNIPVLAGLFSVWYNNFWGAASEAIIPYTQYLRSLPAYLQQGIMESNGKNVDRNGAAIGYQTGAIIWGAPGTNAQHAFFQLMHQGTKLIPADFIGFTKPLKGNKDHQNKLLANFIAQTEALMCGKDRTAVEVELKAQGKTPQEIQALAPFKVFEGNRPTTTFLINQLTPYTLGALIAHYESKLFVQGVLWNIFSFDQWGVELGKQLATNVLTELEATTTSYENRHDPSTTALIQRCSKP